jgi:PDZ domain-containing protein
VSEPGSPSADQGGTPVGAAGPPSVGPAAASPSGAGADAGDERTPVSRSGGGGTEPAGRSRTSRRARTLWIGCSIGVVLLVLGVAIPVPYVALGPGSTFNTIASGQGREVITFAGDDIPAAAAEQPTGHLNMLTIRIVDQIPMFEAIALWASGHYQLAPREEYYPPNKTKQQVNQENIQMFADSQSVAEIEALRHLGYPNVVYVGDIDKASPSWDILKPNDRFTAVDGQAVTDYDSLAAVMAKTRPGQTVAVTVQRDGKAVTRKVTLEANAQVGPQGFLGVGVVERPLAPFSIDISLEDIGGPSAGLMFTLGIIDRLTPGDLSGGKFIAGTGTIDLNGNVGPIGGVTFKEVTARDAGAQYMLVPAANCAEALTAVPDGLTLAKVSTLDDALAAVQTIASGRTPAGC